MEKLILKKLFKKISKSFGISDFKKIEFELSTERIYFKVDDLEASEHIIGEEEKSTFLKMIPIKGFSSAKGFVYPDDIKAEIISIGRKGKEFKQSI